MESGSSHLYLVPSLDRGWVVRELSDGPALRRTTTRRGALDFATLMLARGRGGVITTHDVDGTVVERYEVAELGKQPRWYQRPRPLVLLSPVLMAVISTAMLVDPASSIPTWLGVLILVLAIFSIASIVGSWVLDRHTGPLARKSRLPA